MDNKETPTVKIVKVKSGTFAFHIILLRIVITTGGREIEVEGSENCVVHMSISIEQTAYGYWLIFWNQCTLRIEIERVLHQVKSISKDIIFEHAWGRIPYALNIVPSIGNLEKIVQNVLSGSALHWKARHLYRLVQLETALRQMLCTTSTEFNNMRQLSLNTVKE